ncbi:MAG: glycerol kinase GlpK [Paracoccaceae bacterium]
MSYIVSIDQGTTSTRCILFDQNMKTVNISQTEFKQYFPHSGWVEHDPEDLWNTTVSTFKEVLKKSNLTPDKVAAIGIANQRETTLVWDSKTGKCPTNAIVWQDRRTSDFCKILKDQSLEEMIKNKTGLLLDPYFSSTKLHWILNNIPDGFTKAKNGEIIFGTVDTYLIWKLTGGKSHVTDATNASRTMLFNIKDHKWDEEICNLMKIPTNMLPKVLDSSDFFGEVDKNIFGSTIPILGVAGDQQAATIGQACFNPGMIKSTYGTGCFALLNTGSEIIYSKNNMLTTIAYRLNNENTYALEGSIFVAGAVVQWLRDEMKFMKSANESSFLAEKADKEQRLYFIPAFTGLGAPYWKPNARGAIFGLNRNTGQNEIIKAALESIAYQSLDLINAMYLDFNLSKENLILRVDGGMSASDWTMQNLSNILQAPVDRPVFLETTALGAAWLAGFKADVYPDIKNFSKQWDRDIRFNPKITKNESEDLYYGWQNLIQKFL